MGASAGAELGVFLDLLKGKIEGRNKKMYQILTIKVKIIFLVKKGHAVAHLVEALYYKPEGCEFYSRLSH
jgi:hypothetical protein